MALVLGNVRGKLGGGGTPDGVIPMIEGPLVGTVDKTVGKDRTVVYNTTKSGTWLFIVSGTLVSSSGGSTMNLWINNKSYSVGGAADEDPVAVIVEGPSVRVEVSSGSSTRTVDAKLRVFMGRVS